MRIGVPKEMKNNEFRVAATPAGVAELTGRGHQVFVERRAGEASAFDDSEYVGAGAVILSTAEEVWDRAELVIKVKEPITSEYHHLRKDLTIFTFLHLAADPSLTEALVSSGATAIAYETVQLEDGSLPLLSPMSEVAGRVGVQLGAEALLRTNGGRGMLLGGVPGTPRGRVVVIGGGVAGEQAADVALGLGAEVVVLDVNLSRLRQLAARFDGRITTLRSNAHTISEELRTADLVIGSVLVPGAAAPKLVTDAMVARMRSGSVLVDIAIDQGGCFEGSRPTTHDEPTFPVHESIYYCVANIPGAVPRTSTIALTNATLPFISALADRGVDGALRSNAALVAGLNVRAGEVVNGAVREALVLAANASS